MNTDKQRMGKNKAKVQFLMNAEEVMSMLKQGFNKHNVYTSLFEKGTLTMSYRAFCCNLQKYANPQGAKGKKAMKSAAPGAVAAATSSPLVVEAKKEGFGTMENVNVKELF